MIFFMSHSVIALKPDIRAVKEAKIRRSFLNEGWLLKKG